MPFRQFITPNFSVKAYRGYCLQFVDDAVNAPLRQKTAANSYNVENRNKNVYGGLPPIGIWVVLYFSINGGSYKGLGHVALAFNHGNGWIEIRDSETQTGARSVYTNIQQVISWFGSKNPMTYLGYSSWVDGAHIFEEYVAASSYTPPTGRITAKGTATVLVDALHVRNDPSDDNAIVATYGKGQKFAYDSYQVSDGYVWLSYLSYSGVRRFIAEGYNDGRDDTVWVSGGV